MSFDSGRTPFTSPRRSTRAGACATRCPWASSARDTANARALGKCLGRVDRIRLPVLRQEHRADEVPRFDQRIELFRFAGREHFDGESETAGHRGAAAQLLEALGVARDRERAALAETGRLSGLGLERGIEIGRVLGEAR